MSAETLRHAAALMRERAEGATPGPWRESDDLMQLGHVHTGADWLADTARHADAEHIASWHPVVALAVADWLDSTANDVEHVHTQIYNLTSTTVARAITAARAYLGGDDA